MSIIIFPPTTPSATSNDIYRAFTVCIKHSYNTDEVILPEAIAAAVEAIVATSAALATSS